MSKTDKNALQKFECLILSGQQSKSKGDDCLKKKEKKREMTNPDF